MVKEGRRVVPFPLHQPAGWIERSLPIFQQMVGDSVIGNVRSAPTEQLRCASALRWKFRTGAEPTESAFTLVIPVQNEEKALPSHLATHMLSDIPRDTPMHTVFVVNGSTDRSRGILESFIRSMPDYRQTTLTDTPDPHMSRTSWTGSLGNRRFTLVDTPTPGKCRALNTGNHLALQEGHTIGMNLDADRYPEPHAIALLYGAARRYFVSTSTVLVDGRGYEQFRNRSGVPSQVFTDDTHEATKKVHLSGPFFAWDTRWIHDTGGFPQTVIEDYALGFRAVTQGKEIYHTDAPYWGYRTGNRLDQYRAHTRYARGALQLLDTLDPQDESARTIILHDHHRMQPLSHRLATYSQVGKSYGPISGWFFVMRRILFNEVSLAHAKLQHWRNPHAISWMPTPSAK